MKKKNSYLIELLFSLLSLFLLCKQGNFYFVKILKENKINKIGPIILFLFNSGGILQSFKTGFIIVKKLFQKNENER